MRVLYWTELFWPYIGGVEVLSARLLPALVERGHEVQVLTSHGSLDLPDRELWNGIEVHRVGLQQALAAGDVEQIATARREVAGIKRAFRPDIVHLNVTAGSVYYELRTRRLHPCPLLLSVRLALAELAPAQDSILRAAMEAAAWITANSEAIGDDLRRLVPPCADRISVIYNGLEMPALEPAPLPFDPPTIVSLGRLVVDKGFDVAVGAFGRLVERFPHARMVVAGDGPERTALEDQAARLGLATRITFPGWVAPELVPRLMNDATVAVMPSRWREAFGLVALQAALMARPVVATRVGGIPEVVEDGVTGLLVDNEDEGALSDAMCRLLTEGGVARNMGRLGRIRAIEHFSLDAYVDAYDDLYARLCS